MHSVLDSLTERTWTDNIQHLSGELSAAKNIPKHALVCVFEGATHTRAPGKQTVSKGKTRILHYTGHKGERLLCDPSDSATLGHCVAHSHNPNLYLDLYSTSSGYQICLIAKTHITQGDLLTLDFRPEKRIDVPFKAYTMVSTLSISFFPVCKVDLTE